MTSAFTDVLHVANLTTGSHLMSILTQSDAFSKVFYENDNEIQKFARANFVMKYVAMIYS